MAGRASGQNCSHVPVKSCLGRHGEPLSKGVININFGRCVFITCFGFGLLLSDVKIAVWTANVQLCLCMCTNQLKQVTLYQLVKKAEDRGKSKSPTKSKSSNNTPQKTPGKTPPKQTPKKSPKYHLPPVVIRYVGSCRRHY